MLIKLFRLGKEILTKNSICLVNYILYVHIGVYISFNDALRNNTQIVDN